MKQLLMVAGICIVSYVVASCATIVNGTSQDIFTNSNPSGARIYINGEDRGRTPTTLTLKRKKEYQVVFELDGYENVTVNMDKNFKAGWSIVGNVLSWGLVGIIVDVANGAAYALSPKELNANLRPSGTAMHYNPESDEIMIVFFTVEEWERIRSER